MRKNVYKKGIAFVLALSLVMPVSYAPRSDAAEGGQGSADTAGITSLASAGPGGEASGSDAEDFKFVPGLVPEKYELSYPKRDQEILRGSMDSSYSSEYQTDVRNQGSNGICWTFGTYAVVEANMKKNGISAPDLSELHMAYATSHNGDNSDQGWDRDPSGGGNRYYSSTYLMRGTTLSGTVNEADDPYSDIYTEIPDRELSVTKSKPKSYTVKDIQFLTGSDKPTDAEKDVIKQKIKSQGGVGASMYWKGNAQTGTIDYTYFNISNGAYYLPEVQKSSDGEELVTNHLVEIAGWDDNYSADNFSTKPAGNGAWKVKNSWGKDLGDDGYIWISYYDTNFPLNTFTVDGVESYDSSKKVYETDYKFDGSSIGFNNVKDAYFAKCYKAEEDGTLDSVKVFFVQGSSNISIDCITGFDKKPKTNGQFTNSDVQYFSVNDYEFSSKGAKSIIYPGWYTIKLNTPIALNKGEEFAIIIKNTLTNGAGDNYIGCDNYNSINSSSGVKTYFLQDGEAWAWENQFNFCIKAVVDTVKKDDGKISFSKTAITKTYGDDEFTEAAVLNKTDAGTISYSSSNTDVAAVDPSTGKVTIKAAGETTITATATAGAINNKATYVLTVEPKEVSLSWSSEPLVYNNKIQAPAVTIGGVVNNDKLTATVTGGQINAGTGYTATVTELTGAKAGSYTLPGSGTSTTFSIGKAAWEPETALGLARYGTGSELALSSYIAPGGVLGDIQITDGDNVLSGDTRIEDKVLKYSFVNDAEKVGKTATVTIPVSSQNYNDYSITVTLKVNSKYVPDLNVQDISKTSGGGGGSSSGGGSSADPGATPAASATPKPIVTIAPTAAPTAAPAITAAPTAVPQTTDASYAYLPGETEAPTATPVNHNVVVEDAADSSGKPVKVSTTVDTWEDGTVATTVKKDYEDGTSEEKKTVKISDGSTVVTEKKTEINGDYSKVTLTKPVEGKATIVTVDHRSGASFVRNYEVTKKKEIALKAQETNTDDTSLTVPKTVKADGIIYKITSISKNAFEGNKQITKADIGNNVKALGSGAFAKNTALKTVTIGKKVKTIGSKVFEGDGKLKTITIRSAKSLEKIGKNAFRGISSTAVFEISGTKKEFERVKKLIKSSGVGKKAKFKSLTSR